MQSKPVQMKTTEYKILKKLDMQKKSEPKDTAIKILQNSDNSTPETCRQNIENKVYVKKKERLKYKDTD